MQATIKLPVVNKETIDVLNRVLPDGRSYLERVYVKIGLLIKASALNNAFALVNLYQLHDEIINLSAYFDDEVDKFEGQIEKKKTINPTKVSFIAQSEHDLPCNNPLACSLYELMVGFDKLLSTLKLLHLSGLLESKAALYQLKERYQKKLNTLLSQIIQTPSTQHYPTSVAELIETPDAFDKTSIRLDVLIQALDAPYAPGVSAQGLHQMKYKLKQLVQRQSAKAVEVQA
ncbi:AcaB family transcriptional regulator [Legionella fairfieldensis]|uniref:AcaB family transcriptional regulator n=1 Tax=Legionella fairfieldensis TaxID=45064 RepID=UPI00048FA6AF|nr:AcaB family transcriptional regulator [Legionella fairfieldensis]